METTLILTGVACIVGAIVGGGVKLVQVELAQVSSLRRQAMLGVFGAALIVAGLFAGGHVSLPKGSQSAAAPTQIEAIRAPAPADTAAAIGQAPASATNLDSGQERDTRLVTQPQPQPQQERTVGLPSKVDVFWCEANDGAVAHRDRAERIAPALRDTNAIGRVRVRALSVATNAGSSYGIDADIVRFDPGERAAAEEIATLATRATGGGFVAAPALPGSPSIDYLSVFVCGPE